MIWTWRLEWYSLKPRKTKKNANSLQMLEEAMNRFSLEPLERIQPCWSFDFWLLAFRIVGECFCCLKSPVCGNFLQQPQETNTLCLHFYTSILGVDLFCPLPSLKEMLAIQVSMGLSEHIKFAFPQIPKLPGSSVCLVPVIGAPCYRGKVLTALHSIKLILPITPRDRCIIIFILSILQVEKLRYTEVKSFTQYYAARSTRGRNKTHAVWLPLTTIPGLLALDSVITGLK